MNPQNNYPNNSGMQPGPIQPGQMPMPPATQPTSQPFPQATQAGPLNMQTVGQGPVSQSQFNQPQVTQQQLLQQQQLAAQANRAQTVATPGNTIEGPQTLGSQPQSATPTVVENPISTQSTLLISELRDGVVIMKDGSFRAVVACQSINFDLMSETEREGVEYSYQNFLNSLNFTIQILVRSQRVDIGPYIERLSNIRRNNDNMLLGVLMDDYINFIDILSQEANIMDKSFFIVIPYYSSADAEKLVQQTKNLFKTFGKKAPAVTRINRDTYNKAVDELNNRVESVISGLFNIGIHSVRLKTRELAELYYNFNNPDTAVREPLVDFTKLATTYVRKGEGENPNGQER